MTRQTALGHQDSADLENLPTLIIVGSVKRAVDVSRWWIREHTKEDFLWLHAASRQTNFCRSLSSDEYVVNELITRQLAEPALLFTKC